MKNVLLWIASIFSMLLDAVKKSKLEITTNQVFTYEMSGKAELVQKGEQVMIIITSSINNVKAYKQVAKYAEDHGFRIVGTYIENGKRNFLLCKTEG